MNVFKFLGVSLVSVLAVGCGGGSGSLSQADSAANLQKQIQADLGAGRYQEALAGIDSFQRAFPLQVEIRRELLKTRAQAVEGLALQRLPQLTAEIARLSMVADSLQGFMVSVRPSQALLPYLVYKEAKSLSSPGIQARVNTGDDAEYIPWTLAVDAGRNIGVSGVSVKVSDGAVFDIPVKSADGQMGTASPEAASALGAALQSGQQAVSASVNGSKGKVSVKVSPAVSRGILLAYEFASARTQLRQNRVDAEKTDRLLQLSRDQAAQ